MHSEFTSSSTASNIVTAPEAKTFSRRGLLEDTNSLSSHYRLADIRVVDFLKNASTSCFSHSLNNSQIKRYLENTGIFTMQMNRVENHLQSFKDLKTGWNGYDAPPIPEAVIRIAGELLHHIRYVVPEVFPTGRESVQFEFDHNDHSLEIEVFKDAIHVDLFNDTDLIKEWSLDLDGLEGINECIAELYGY